MTIRETHERSRREFEILYMYGKKEDILDCYNQILDFVTDD